VGIKDNYSLNHATLSCAWLLKILKGGASLLL